MIFLSKGGKDPYVNMFAKGCRSVSVDPDEFEYDTSTDAIVLRGILKKKIIHKCWRNNRTFFYMDTGYFGNEISKSNPQGWKFWHRIVKNDLQHTKIKDVPDDRFQNFKKKIKPWKKDGRKILIAAPDDKPMKFYGLTLDTWLNETINEIKKYTDRPIEVRKRDPERINRTVHKPFLEAIHDDVFALVTFNSNAAVESIFEGIPVFPLAPSSAAKPVSKQDLSLIEKPYYPDSDLVYRWGCSLAYGQFHSNELRSGKAKELMQI